MLSEQHCTSCTCGKRAPVQENRKRGKGPGSIAWAEHLKAWSGYAAEYGSSQSAERMAERGGFCYGELIMFLGHEPETWVPGELNNPASFTKTQRDAAVMAALDARELRIATQCQAEMDEAGLDIIKQRTFMNILENALDAIHRADGGGNNGG
jgi:hypothetical protein